MGVQPQAPRLRLPRAIGLGLPHTREAHFDHNINCDPGKVLSKNGYQMLCWIGMALSVALAVLMTLFPETPSFLASRDNLGQAERVLKKLRGIPDAEEVDSIPEVETEMQELRDKLAEKQESDEPAAGLADLLDPDLRMPMIIACTLMIL